MLCALCGESDLALQPEPLGRDDRMVLVCLYCRRSHPRSGRYSFDASEPGPCSVGRRDGNTLGPRRDRGVHR